MQGKGKKIKVVELVEKLTEKEFRNLGKFIHSPFFNESRLNVKLYELIKTERKKNNIDSVGLTYISEKIYPGEKNTSLKLRKLVSGFCELMEEFYIQNSLTDNHDEKKIFYIKELRKRNAHSIFCSELKELREKIKTEGAKFQDYYLTDFRISLQEFIDISNRDQSDDIPDILSRMNQEVDRLYIYRKLFIMQYMLGKDNLNNSTEAEFSEIERIKTLIESNREIFKTSEPKIYSLYLILSLYSKQNSERIFAELLEYLKSIGNRVETEFIKYIYSVLFKLTIEQINNGKVQFNTALEMYEIMCSYNVFGKLRTIDALSFFGAVYINCYFDKADEAEKFIYLNNEKLNQETRKDVLVLAMGILKYKQKKYEEALGYLKNYKTKNYTFYLFSRATLIKIYLETDKQNFLLPLLESFKKYFKRKNDISEKHISHVEKFLYYTNKLIIAGNNRRELQNLKEKVNGECGFIFKKWVEERIIHTIESIS